MIDFFGYLNMDYSICFEDVKICPIEKFSEVKNWVKNYVNEDGFVYPPLEHRIELDMETLKEKRVIPNTERQSLLHKIPYSHSIIVKDPAYKNELRKWDYAFLVNILAFLHGTRLQFYNWQFDGRIPIKNIDNIYIHPNSTAEFLQTVYKTWRGWKKINQERIINLLVMHNRIPTYEWEFERFLLNYIVFDGAIKIAEKVYHCKASSHDERFYSVIEKFGIANNDEHIRKIYRLRNDLFHYAIWDGGHPCSPKDIYKGWIQENYLRKFNLRLLVALLDYKTDFVSMPWWIMGNISIDANFYKNKANPRLNSDRFSRIKHGTSSMRSN